MLAKIRRKALLYWDLIDPSWLGYYRKLSRPVDGWLTRDEEAALFRLARQVPATHCIVELGSWFGRSAILLGGGSKIGHGAPVYAVDLFEAAGCAKDLLAARAGDEARDFWSRFHENIKRAGLDTIVTAVRSHTAELGDGWNGPPIGLLFIDADHSYEGVRSDWVNWRPRLTAQSRIAFHDYENTAYEGVTRFVDELCAAGALDDITRHDSILCARVADGQPAG